MTASLLLTHCGARPTHVADAWAVYAERFVSGGRVIDRDNGNITHSEGQGYGMLFASAAADRDAFERIWEWTQRTLGRDDGLFSWRFRPCPAMDRSCVDDPNNASDGDLLIAWALLRASERWNRPRWEAQARHILDRVGERLLREDHGYLFLLPGLEGFVESTDRGSSYIINPSYYIFPALRDFAAQTQDPRWDRLRVDGERLLRASRFGERRLHPDWLRLDAGGLAPAKDMSYGYNACRIPLHVIWDPARSAALLDPYLAFWARGTPPATVDLRSGDTANYPWSLGMATLADTVTARLRGTLASVASDAPGRVDAAEGYFSASLVMLSLVAWSDLESRT